MTNDHKIELTSRRKLLRTGVCAVTFMGLGMHAAQAAKASKGSVSYREAPNGDKNCASCSLFASPNACKSVEGQISPNGWCKIWRG